MSAELFGFIAGGITTLSFLPQVIRVFKLKSAHEISLLFTILTLIGLACWIAYGVFFHLMPIILWNSAFFMLAFALFYAKLKYGR